MGKPVILVEVTVKVDFQRGNTPVLTGYAGSSSPGGKNVVSSTGGIDLTKVDKGSDDSTIALISFALDAKNNPNKVPLWFQGIELTTNLGAPYGGPELKGATTPNQIVILDLDMDGDTYNYCLTLGYGSATPPATLKLDPPIVNRAQPPV